MASEKLILRRGDTTSFTVRAKSQNLSGYDGKFTVKSNASDTENVMQIAIPSGTFSSPDTDFVVSVGKDDWGSVDPGSYVYDVEVTNGTNVYTLALGFCIIENDVTRS